MRRKTAIAAALAALLVCAAGCPPIDPGADKVLVTIERSEQAAFDTLDEYLAFYQENRDWLVQAVPAARDIQVKITTDGKAWLRAYDDAIAAYRTSRKPEDGEAANGVLLKIQTLAHEARQILLSAQKSKPTTRST